MTTTRYWKSPETIEKMRLAAKRRSPKMVKTQILMKHPWRQDYPL